MPLLPVTILLLLLLLLSSQPYIIFADPDPLQDYCVADLKSAPSINGFPCKPPSEVTSKDFFYSGLRTEGTNPNAWGSNLNLANVMTFPALNTLGVSMNRLDIIPTGINPPHTHPRATEIVVVVEGKVLVGFVTTGEVYYSQVLGKGEVFVVPKGLMHFQLNVGKKKATLFTAFNSQLPGTVNLPNTLFASKSLIPDDVLTRAFMVNASVVHLIESNLKRAS